jgi:hypothetical protein
MPKPFMEDLKAQELGDKAIKLVKVKGLDIG